MFCDLNAWTTEGIGTVNTTIFFLSCCLFLCVLQQVSAMQCRLTYQQLQLLKIGIAAVEKVGINRTDPRRWLVKCGCILVNRKKYKHSEQSKAFLLFFYFKFVILELRFFQDKTPRTKQLKVRTRSAGTTNSTLSTPNNRNTAARWDFILSRSASFLTSRKCRLLCGSWNPFNDKRRKIACPAVEGSSYRPSPCTTQERNT